MASFIDKYERVNSVFSSEESSWSIRDVGMVNLLSGLLAAKQVLKLWPEKGLDGGRSYFCFSRTKPFSSRFSLHIKENLSTLSP